MDPADLPAADAAARLRAGTLAPEALREACLARIAAREGELRVFAWFDEHLRTSRSAVSPPPEAPRAAPPRSAPRIR